MTLINESLDVKKNIAEIENLQQYLLDIRNQFSINTIGTLIEELKNISSSYALNNKNYIDSKSEEDLKNAKILETLEKCVLQLSQFNSKIEFDLTPVLNIVSEYNKKNDLLLENIKMLIQNTNTGEEDKQRYEALLKMSFSIINKSNIFLEENLKTLNPNYSSELQSINKAIQDNKPVEWEFKVIRDREYQVDKVIAKPKFK